MRHSCVSILVMGQLCAAALVMVGCHAGDRVTTVNTGQQAGASAAGGARLPAPSATPGSATPAPAGSDPAEVAAVEAVVKARNDEERAEQDKFEQDGWVIVDGVAAPDMALVGYDPALVDSKPEELRTQLMSTTATSADLPQIAAIARATSGELRLAAIEAISRVRNEASQAALHELLASAALRSDVEARMTLVPLLRPTDLDDSFALKMALLLDSSTLSEIEKNQVAFTLAAVGLRDGTDLPTAVLASISSSAQARLDAARALAAR